MRLANLLDRLPEDSVQRVSLSDPDCDVYNVSFMTPEALEHPRGDVLYFTDSELLPTSISDDRHFNCVVVDGGQAPEGLDEGPTVNLVWLAMGVDLFACYNAIQGAFLEDQALASVIQRLLAAHFSNQGLQYLVEEAANALHNPIVVVDTTYRYVAFHLGDLHVDDTQLARVMTEEIAHEIVPEEAVSYIRDSKIDSQIARKKGPYEEFNARLGCNTMTSAVMVHGVCLAHVMMMERTHTFTDFDREVFARLTLFVGQELQKSEVWGPTNGELGSYFLENLLNDRNASVAVTRRRMKALNFHPKPVLYVVCLHASGEGLSQMQCEHLAAQLQPVLHHSLYTRFHQHLVALISRDYDEGLTPTSIDKLREIAALNELSVGVSNAFTSVTDARAAYDQARAAIRFGDQAASIDDQRIYRYCDYACQHMLDVAGRRMNLLSLCHPALLTLMDYDEAHGGELMETLFWYLQMAGSTARAASLLTLHKNTMLYRLGRIRELLGMDLASGEDLFELQVSFRLLIALGLFHPRLRVTREQLRG